MAAADDDFDFLLTATTRLLGEISEEIGSRREEGERGVVLAAHVLDALGAIQVRVAEEERRYPSRSSEASKKAGARALRFYAQLVWATHSALGWLSPSEEQQLDLGALYFADETALALLGKGVEVNPVASGDYMYSISSWPFDWLSEELGRPGGERPIPIVLTYPAHESPTMLLHSLFAHELSHAVVREGNLVNVAIAPLQASGDYQSWLDEAVQKSGKLGTFVQGRAPELLRSWVEELLCDALAFATLGPSYLFAFAEMGLSVGWSEPDDEHPSMALRTLLLIGFAERNGFSALLEERMPRTRAWLQFAAAGPSKLQNPAESFADRACRHSLEHVTELAKQALGNHYFTPEKWEPNHNCLLELLENDILPVEVRPGEPATHAEILLACWLGALESHGDRPGSISAALGEADYQRFVAKALEMSTMLRVWPQAAGTGEKK